MAASASRSFRRLLVLKPVRNALLLLVCACSLAVSGLVQAHRAEPMGVSETMPLLRHGVVDLLDNLLEGVKRVAENPTAFPSSATSLGLLGAVALVLPAMATVGLSSAVLANLTLGIVLGPSGLGVFNETGWSENIAQVGVLFFLYEMGLQLSTDKLKRMWPDVFIIGLSQFVLSAGAISFLAWYLLHLSRLQSFIIGVAMSLSSTTLVQQLLDEQKGRGTRHGRTVLGILLMQDFLAPLLLVLLPLLAAPSISGSLNASRAMAALAEAMFRTLFSLVLAAGAGRLLLGGLFSFVAASNSPAALRCLSFFAIFGTCFSFESFGLPSTLGAILAGVLIAETAYRQQVELVVAPIREDFLGLFFITVGFSMNLGLVFTRPLDVISGVSALCLVKTLVTTGVCRLTGQSLVNSHQVGLLLSQAGEFAFVILSTARTISAFDRPQSELLVTIAGVSLAITPLLAHVGSSLAEHVEQSTSGVDRRRAVYSSLDATGLEVKAGSPEVVMCGYGRVGKMISQVLDKRMVRWMAYDTNPFTVNEARKKDLPVFYGDVVQMISSTLPGKKDALTGAKAAVITLPTEGQTLRAAVLIRRQYPTMRVLARVTNMKLSKRLAEEGVTPLVPIMPEDSMLLNLPIGIALLEELGYKEDDIAPIIRDKRLELFHEEEEQGRALSDDFGLQTLAKLPADLVSIAIDVERRERGDETKRG